MRKRDAVTLDSSIHVQNTIKHKLHFKIPQASDTSVIILGTIYGEFYTQINVKKLHQFHRLVPLLTIQLNTYPAQKGNWA